MNHQTKKLTACLAAAAAVILSGSVLPLNASAGSVEDVYDAMRRIGMPESMIQEAKLQYQNTEHDENGMSINGTYFTYDVWADMVEIYEDDIWTEVGKQFGISGEEIKKASTETAPAQTSAADPPAQTPAQPEKPAVSVEPSKPFVNMMSQACPKKNVPASSPVSPRLSETASSSKWTPAVRQISQAASLSSVNSSACISPSISSTAAASIIPSATVKAH